jgi:hypothetical protein
MTIGGTDGPEGEPGVLGTSGVAVATSGGGVSPGVKPGTL